MERDRSFALFDESDTVINGKRQPRVHEVRARYDAGLTRARFDSPRVAEPIAFVFGAETTGLANWLAAHFERPVSVRRELDGGFPDDLQAPGPTVISTATLAAVASWFEGLSADDVRRRLRANIEIDGVPAFWEDRLFAVAGETVPFRIGNVVLYGTNPCARCVVPSRDPLTGTALPEFAKVVAERRAAELPAWSERTRFDHFYRLALNTRAEPAHAGRSIHAGDAIAVLSKV